MGSESAGMAGFGQIIVRYCIHNERAVKALALAYESVSQIVEEQPWNDDAKKAKRMIRRAVKGLVMRGEAVRKTCEDYNRATNEVNMILNSETIRSPGEQHAGTPVSTDSLRP